MTSMEEKYSNLEGMINKLLEFHTQQTTSEARASLIGLESGGNPNVETMREDREVEVLGEEEEMPSLGEAMDSCHDYSTSFTLVVDNLM
ncbi:hypothetical protein KFK09_012409 [Dendrobium nobile]|uniref:Uncharacterized protein n=1 Tax=Dendrobium nobile TaxID=94219 RepID=A0A8T3BHS5_DENNO|nr:hypothetical protein KFK09_012409 [Dendrobium nobile]